MRAGSAPSRGLPVHHAQTRLNGVASPFNKLPSAKLLPLPSPTFQEFTKRPACRHLVTAADITAIENFVHGVIKMR